MAPPPARARGRSTGRGAGLAGLRGSDGFGRPHSVPDLGVWAVRVLDALRIERADIVGVSMGGGAALWLALEHPDRVRRVVAVDSYGLAVRAPLHPLSWALTRLPLGATSEAILGRSRWACRRALASIVADPSRIEDALVSEAMAAARAGGLTTFGRFQRAEVGPRGLRTVLLPRLDAVRAATLFVHGRHDGLVPLAAATAAAARVPNARLAVLDAGHWPMREVPDRFNGVVRDFLGVSAAP